MTSVVLDNVSKQYGSAPPSVKNINFTVEDGEFFTLLGPSGCGKSTTLRMVAGFLSPTQGAIKFAERDVTRTPPYRRDAGMVFQNYALFPHMDVAANVAYGLHMRKVGRVERDQRVDEALRIVGLGEHHDRRIDQLSGGQQQRVALARALVISPSVLLLDEPLSNLDAKLREETRTQIRQIQQRSQTTSMYVTHDQAEAMAISDRIAVMESGVLHQLDTPREVYRHPATAFVASFIGRSNVVHGTVISLDSRALTVKLEDGATLLAPIHPNSVSERAAVGETVALSIRPEASELVGKADEGTELTAGHLRARLVGIEFTGSTCQLELDYSGSTFGVTIPDTDDLPTIGELVELRPDTEKTWVVKP